MNNARLAVGLDAGSSRTRVVVCTLDDDQFRFLSYADSPSAGWNRGDLTPRSTSLDDNSSQRLARLHCTGLLLGCVAPAARGR